MRLYRIGGNEAGRWVYVRTKIWLLTYTRSSIYKYLLRILKLINKLWCRRLVLWLKILTKTKTEYEMLMYQILNRAYYWIHYTYGSSRVSNWIKIWISHPNLYRNEMNHIIPWSVTSIDGQFKYTAGFIVCNQLRTLCPGIMIVNWVWTFYKDVSTHLSCPKYFLLQYFGARCTDKGPWCLVLFFQGSVPIVGVRI